MVESCSNSCYWWSIPANDAWDRSRTTENHQQNKNLLAWNWVLFKLNRANDDRTPRSSEPVFYIFYPSIMINSLLVTHLFRCSGCFMRAPTLMIPALVTGRRYVEPWNLGPGADSSYKWPQEHWATPDNHQWTTDVPPFDLPTRLLVGIVADSCSLIVSYYMLLSTSINNQPTIKNTFQPISQPTNSCRVTAPAPINRRVTHRGDVTHCLRRPDAPRRLRTENDGFFLWWSLIVSWVNNGW